MPIKSERERRYVHPARLNISYWRQNKKLDQRTALGKALKALRQRLIDDVGGRINEGQEVLIDRLIEKLLVLNLISGFIFNVDNIINDKGELMPCLGSNYLAYSNSVRLDIQAFYNLNNVRGRADQSYLDIMAEQEKAPAG
jgi:hypothetical protein